MISTPSAAEGRRLRLAALALLAWACAVLLLAPSSAKAQSCGASVSSANFAGVDVLAGASVNGSATLSFSCTGLVAFVPVTLCPNLAGGDGGGDGAGGRLMAGPSGATLAFQIYQDSARTLPWGSTSFLAFGSTPTLTATPDAQGRASLTRQVYLRVSPTAAVRPGHYASTFANQNFFWGVNLLSCAGVTVGTGAVPAAFTISADVDPNCTVAASTLAFGNVGVLTAARDAENQVSVTCTATTPYTVGLGNGLYGSGPTLRQMAKGGERVRYGVYKDVDRTQPWGDAAQGASLVWSRTGTGAAQLLTGYGRAPAQATPSPGAYADTVVTTITY